MEPWSKVMGDTTWSMPLQRGTRIRTKAVMAERVELTLTISGGMGPGSSNSRWENGKKTRKCAPKDARRERRLIQAHTLSSTFPPELETGFVCFVKVNRCRPESLDPQASWR